MFNANCGVTAALLFVDHFAFAIAVPWQTVGLVEPIAEIDSMAADTAKGHARRSCALELIAAMRTSKQSRLSGGLFAGVAFGSHGLRI